MTPRNAGCVYLVSGLWCRSGSLRTSSGFQWQTVNIAVSAVCPQQLDMGNENYKGILNESSLFCFPAIPSKECSVLGDYILLVGPWMCYADHGMDTWAAKDRSEALSFSRSTETPSICSFLRLYVYVCFLTPYLSLALTHIYVAFFFLI